MRPWTPGYTTMLKLQFIGKILPEPVKISVSAPEVKWKWQEENLELTFRVRIDNSVVNVECDIERYEAGYLAELHRRAFDLARASKNWSPLLPAMASLSHLTP